MDAIDALRSRISVGPRMLGDPGPDEAALHELIEVAMAAPDHGGIRPWRFVVFRGAEREALGETFAKALAARKPDATPEELATERARPLRAPVVVAILARIATDRPKIPAIEQVVAAGAAATMMLVAAHARGLGAMLLTGDNAYDPVVRQAFGLAEPDAMIGFLYLGTPKVPPPSKPRPAPDGFIETFSG